jgi:peroxiredoxin
MRQLVAWEGNRELLLNLDCQVVAASSDTEEDVAQIPSRHNINFTLAHSITRTDADALGAGWSNDHQGSKPSDGHIEPTEFILTRYGIVLGSMYASGAVGRMDPEEVIQLIKGRESRRKR